MDRRRQRHVVIRQAPHERPATALKFTYDIWCDAVNVAARMQTNGEPGRVHVSEQTWERVQALFEAEPRGTIEAKHKGRLSMFFLTRIRPGLARDRNGHLPGEEFYAARDRMGI